MILRLPSLFLCFPIFVAAVLFAPGAAAQPAGAKGEDFLYRVARDDTLEQLALRFTQSRSNWPALQQLNQVQDPYKLPIGKVLKIPFSLIPEIPDHARVSHMVGQALAEGRTLFLDDMLAEGQTVRTGPGSSVTLTLSDNSTLSVAPESSLRLKHLRSFKGTGIVDIIVLLDGGTLESRVDPQKYGVGRFEVRTPITVTGVRGTGLRVHAKDGSVFNEVVQGQAAVDGAGPAERALRAREGIVVNEAGQTSGVRRLLEAPTLPAPVRGAGGWTLDFPAIPAARSYQARVTADPEGTELVSSREFPQPHITFSAPRPGTYYVFVRAVDEQGLGGLDASLPFEGQAALTVSDGSPVMFGFGQTVSLQQY